MPELRQDPLTGEWVIIAAERARRPEGFARKANKKKYSNPGAYDPQCPFCPGNEALTPAGGLVYRLEHTTPVPACCSQNRPAEGVEKENNPRSGADWAVRVVPNKYPALQRDAGINGETALPDKCGYFQSYPGYGIHEVIIETPVHNQQLEDLQVEALALVLRVFKDRTIALGRDPLLRYVQIFRNYRQEAGASLIHPHSQLLGLPFIPPVLDKEYMRAHSYYLERGRCLLCTLLEEEQRRGQRVVLENSSFVAYIPFAAPLPFKILIVPREHVSSLEMCAAGWEDELAPLLRDLLARLASRLDDPPYNLYLHSAPLRSRFLPYYHWHLELVPKLTAVAGWEMATGTYINVSRPEAAAMFLRD